MQSKLSSMMNPRRAFRTLMARSKTGRRLYRRFGKTGNKRLIENLEIHLVHGCNLTCESCSHYSNQGHKGILSLQEAERWMLLWKERIQPMTFSLLGGEPTLHPDLSDFVVLARKHWPKARLRLVTNGFFLHRHRTLPALLQRDPDACIEFSIHHQAPEYLERLRPVLELLKDWRKRYGIKVSYLQSYRNWTRRYLGFGAGMQPFQDGRPRESWKHCPARYCPQLLDGRIYKCGPLAYLKMQNEKYRLADSWKTYLQYRPLDPECTPAELEEFFAREEEPYCGMCAAKPQAFRIAVPMPNRGPR
jgi:Predicted Fe-S oxidoreductases